MPKFQDAFGLRENPFCPTSPLPGIKNPLSMANLKTRPMQVRREHALDALYCEDVCAECLGRFASLAGDGGYEPPQIGVLPLLVVILGSQGTGKTTLANRMVRHLQECAPPTRAWQVFDSWADMQFNSPEQQIAKIAELRDQVLAGTKEGDYCCVLVDNLVSGAEGAAMGLYLQLLTNNRVASVFAMSSDLQLISKPWDNMIAGPEVYRTSELDPDTAVRYVRKRISAYRIKDAVIPAEHELLPFQADVIVAAVTRSGFDAAGALDGIISLRQLNSTLCRVLRNARDDATVPAMPITLKQLQVAW